MMWSVFCSCSPCGSGEARARMMRPDRDAEGGHGGLCRRADRQRVRRGGPVGPAASGQLIPCARNRLPPIMTTAAVMNAVTSPINSV